MPGRPVESHDPDLLAHCLAELDERGWDLDTYLSDRPELPASLPTLLRAAARVKQAPHPTVSSEFRAQARARFAARLQDDSTPSRSLDSGWVWPLRGALAPIGASVAAVLVVAAAIGGIGTASAASLPGMPLYPAKIAVESVQLFTAYTPELQAQTHLRIAEARLVEADAENKRGDQTEVDLLLKSYQQQIVYARAAAANAASPQYHSQVDEAVTTLDAKRKVIVPSALVTAEETVVPTPRPTEAVFAATSTPQPTFTPAKQPGATAPSPTSTRAAPSVGPAGRPARSTPSSSPSEVARAQARPPDRPGEDIVSTLIARARDGDAPGAAAATAAFITQLRSTQRLNQGVIMRLRRQRAQLAQALAIAPQSTADSLRQALRAIDAALGNSGLRSDQSGNDQSANDQAGPPDGNGTGSGNSRNGGHGGSDGHKNDSGDVN